MKVKGRSHSSAAVRCCWLLQTRGISFYYLQVHASLNQRLVEESQMDLEIPDALTSSQGNFHVLCHILKSPVAFPLYSIC